MCCVFGLLGEVFFVPNVSRGPPESSGRPQPGRAEPAQHRAGSPLPQPVLPSSKRHPCPNHKRQPFFQSLCAEPLFSHTPQQLQQQKKYTCSRFSLFYPAKSPPPSFFSGSNPLCLRAPSLLRSTFKGEKKRERKKKNRCCCWGWFITNRRCLWKAK